MANKTNRKPVSKNAVNAALKMAAETEHPTEDVPVEDVVIEVHPNEEVEVDEKLVDLELSEVGRRLERVYNISHIVSANVTKREPVSELDELENFLGDCILAAKAGRYADIKLKTSDKKDIAEFIQSYHPESVDTGTQACAIAKMLLMVGKSVFEYSPETKFLDDIAYDALLAAWKKNHVEPVGIVPTGAPGREKVKIRFPNLSNNLDKSYRIGKDDRIPGGVKEEDSIEDFLERTFAGLGLTDTDQLSLVMSPKIDGVSVNALIADGKMTKPASRGDADSNMRLKGLEGYRVSKDSNHEPFAIQYEAYVSKANVKALAKATGTEYVNCRSAASGIINRMSADPDAKKYAKFLCFYPINAELVQKPYAEKLAFIDKFGTNPADMPSRRVITGTKTVLLEELRKEFSKLESIRAKLSFEIDGMVLSVLDDKLQAKLGRTGRTNLWQIAMKFDPASAIAYVDSVSVSCGNKGARTIMVNLKEPAIIDGVEYPTATVLSMKSFEGLGLRKGSKIEVIRTGDVIPSFVVLEPGDGELLKKPDTCPACGEPLAEVAGRLHCPNDQCSANIVGRFVNLFTNLWLDNYSEEFANNLMTKAHVDTLEKLFNMTAADLVRAGMTGKLEDQFVDLLHGTLAKTPDYRILAALGFPGIGRERAKTILSVIDTDKLDELTIPEVEDILTASAGFKTTANAIATTIITNRDLIKQWMGASHLGKTDFTKMRVIGHSGVEIPEEFEKKILDAGWDITDGSRFDLLVIPDINYTSRKTKNATKKNIPIITVAELEQHPDSLDELFTLKLTNKDGNVPKAELDMNMPEPDAIPDSEKSSEASAKADVTEPIRLAEIADTIHVAPSSDKLDDRHEDKKQQPKATKIKEDKPKSATPVNEKKSEQPKTDESKKAEKTEEKKNKKPSILSNAEFGMRLHCGGGTPIDVLGNARSRLIMSINKMRFSL